MMQAESRDEDKASVCVRESQPEEVACDAHSESLHQRGNVNQCPICGSGIDPEAYHCPSCRN